MGKGDMNLYLLTQDVNNGFDTYDSAVVAAESRKAARAIHPGGFSWDGRCSCSGSWCNQEEVNIKLIGKAKKGVSGIVCTSFNAG